MKNVAVLPNNRVHQKDLNSFGLTPHSSKVRGLTYYEMHEDLFLYRRGDFEKVFTFLEDKVIGLGAIGWVLGPPGTGKSGSALAFISTLDRNEWVITWLHL